MKLLKNGKILTAQGFLRDHCIVFDEKIKSIQFVNHMNFENVEVEIDAGTNYVFPGFIDIHIHGIAGADVMDGTQLALSTMSKELTKNGVTSFLPTTMTMHIDKIQQALENVRQYMKKPKSHARVLGVHMEGPYISSVFKGAQVAENIIEPDINWVRAYYDIIKILTIAPEAEGALEFIKKVKEESDIILSIGHSDASYNICKCAKENGASHVTHLFNAMKPLHHREPGVVGAALDMDFTCEVILDTIHINPLLFNFILKAKGTDKLIGISDCMRAGCLMPGEYELGGQKVLVDSTSARLVNGQLAGSILKLNHALKNLKHYSDIDLIEAVRMFTLNPAKLLGRFDIGEIAEGYLSDFVVMNDNFEVITTVVNGEIVFDRGVEHENISG